MTPLIIYASFHHQNTKKIAEVIGQELGAKIISLTEVTPEDIAAADLIGFGSGIYFAKFHRGIINLIKQSSLDNKSVFIFSTYGASPGSFLNNSHKHLKKLLMTKNCRLVGEFNCPGLDTYGLLKFFGGKNKGRPNREDIQQAVIFAQSLEGK